jgi:DNA ligase-1
MNEFDNLEGTQLFTDRQIFLKNILKTQSSINLHLVEQIIVKSWDHLEELRQYALDHGWEGLILRKNKIYISGRSTDMLKVKYFKDSEFIIKDTEMGPIRYIAYDNGKSFEKEEIMLSAIMVEFENNIVRCGSGFSLEERMYYYKHPEELIGKQATIKYFQETQNKSGSKSIRFPTFKKLWTGESREDEE